MEVGDFLYLTHRNSDDQFFGRYLGDYRVTLLATTENNQVVDSVLQNTKDVYLDDYRYSPASQRLVNSYYSKQDPKLVDFIVQGTIL
jgi:hypothetical protein